MTHLTDPDTGFKIPVTQAAYDNFLKTWEILTPKLDQKIGIPLVFGTGGDLDKIDFKPFTHAPTS